MARRKNATFTLDQTYGSGHGDRALIQAFYAKLNALHPGSTPVPIPRESHVHPGHDMETQMLIFADFAVRKIAPIALRAADLEVLGAKLEQLDQITKKTAIYVAAELVDVVFVVRRAAAACKANRHAALTAAYAAAADACEAARLAARLVHEAAPHFPDGPRHADAYVPRVVSAYAALTAAYAAKLNRNATWAAVNEMLQAL